MKLRFWLAAGAAVFAAAVSGSAAATTVFSEGLATPTPTAQFSKADGQQEASQFSISSTTDVVSATFYGSMYYGGNLPNTFMIQFFSSDSNDMPLAQLYSANVGGTATTTGLVDNNYDNIYAITANFSPFTALAGVKYFFAASDVAGTGYNFVVESSGTGVGRQTGGGLGNYYALSTGEAFSLSDASVPTGGVPEPATWAMMLLGFGGLGATVRSRRRMLAAA